MPTPDLFAGVDDLEARVHLMVRELAAFFDRSDPWWRISQESSDVEFWADAEQRYYRDLDALIRAALGPLAGDDDAVAMIITVIGRWVIGALQETGRSTDRAVDLVSGMFSAWLKERSARASGD